MVNQSSSNLMSNFKFELPFEVERACRCSFVVRLENGERAFISNQNLFTLIRAPWTPFQVMKRTDHRTGIEQAWIMIQESKWTFGFKTRLFGIDGNRI